MGFVNGVINPVRLLLLKHSIIKFNIIPINTICTSSDCINLFTNGLIFSFTLTPIHKSLKIQTLFITTCLFFFDNL